MQQAKQLVTKQWTSSIILKFSLKQGKFSAYSEQISRTIKGHWMKCWFLSELQVED